MHRELSRRSIATFPFYGLAVACIDHPVVREHARASSAAPRWPPHCSPTASARDADIGLRNRRGSTRDSIDVRRRARRARQRRRAHARGSGRVPVPGQHNALNALAAHRRCGGGRHQRRRHPRGACRASPASSAASSRPATWNGVADLRRLRPSSRSRSPPCCGPRAPAPRAASSPWSSRIATRACKTCSTSSAACFDDADIVIVTPLYSAGEAPIAGIDRRALGRRHRARPATAASLTVDSEDASWSRPSSALAQPGDHGRLPRRRQLTEWAHALPRMARRDRASRGQERRLSVRATSPTNSHAQLPELRGRLKADARARRHHLVPRRRSGRGSVHAGRRGRSRLFPGEHRRPTCPSP